jgi:hypothetical protein
MASALQGHHPLRQAPSKTDSLCPIRDLLTANLAEELFGDRNDSSTHLLHDATVVQPASTISRGSALMDTRDRFGFSRGTRQISCIDEIARDSETRSSTLPNELKPQTIIAENVKGMILGNAKGYCKMVMQRLRDLGYRPQLFLINAADCGVPQRRERVFFCAVRNDVSDRPLKLTPKHRWISVGEATRDLQGTEQTRARDVDLSDLVRTLWNGTKPGDSLDQASLRINKKPGWFTWNRLAENQPSPTVVSGADSTLHWSEPRKCSFAELKRIGSFPDDYVARTNAIGKYMVGMSVPPKMMEVVARAVCSQWLGVCRG